MPNCVIVVRLYVLSWIFVFLVAANCSFVAIETNCLYRCNGIMFPSLPVSTLYCTVITLMVYLDLLLLWNVCY